MSTFLQTERKTVRIHSKEDLRPYFHDNAKPAQRRRIGIECELLGVEADSGRAMSFSGKHGIERVLKELAYLFGYEEILEADRVIALKKNGNIISLEPGAQLELSASPVASVHDARRQLDDFFFELKTVSQFIGGIAFLGYGIHPMSRAADIEWVPKRRYAIMAKYLYKRGKLAWHMMKRTATNQVSLDYTSEDDALTKWCLVMRLTSVASAMFANSPISHGKPSGFVTERMHIWRHTDPERAGLVDAALCPNALFDGYLDYLLRLPMMFIVRKNRWVTLNGRMTFARFIERGFQGEHATLDDFELHLSTAFPVARFKQYLEIRGMDAQRSHLITAIPAFWKGILYSESSSRAADRLFRKFGEKDFRKLEVDILKNGLRAKLKTHSVLDLARELVMLSERGLEESVMKNERGEDERVYLEPLKCEVLKPGITSSEMLLKLWSGPFRKNPKALVSYLKV